QLPPLRQGRQGCPDAAATAAPGSPGRACDNVLTVPGRRAARFPRGSIRRDTVARVAAEWSIAAALTRRPQAGGNSGEAAGQTAGRIDTRPAGGNKRRDTDGGSTQSGRVAEGCIAAGLTGMQHGGGNSGAADGQTDNGMT